MPNRTKKETDVSRALNALRRMVRALRSAADTVEQELKISAAQLYVLRELMQQPDQSVKDLASVTMTTHSTVSQVVTQLIAKGLVTKTRHESDGRRAVLRLTRSGAQVVKRAPRAIQEDLIDGFQALRSSEQKSLASGLERWLEASGLGTIPSLMLFEKPAGKAGDRGR